MRSNKTHWNRSYNGPSVDSDKKLLRAIKAARRPIKVSKAQQESKDFFARSLTRSNRGPDAVRCARRVHPDDAEAGRLRKLVDQESERQKLDAELREVWE